MTVQYIEKEVVIALLTGDDESFFVTYRKNNPGEVVITSENGERRVLRSTPCWTEEAVNADHLWVATSASGDLCYASEAECTVSNSFFFNPRSCIN